MPPRETSPEEASPRWVRDLHLFVMSTFAFTQPLYDILARNGEFFVARRAQPADVLFLLFVASIAAPLSVVALHRMARVFGARAGRGSFTALLTLLVTSIAMTAGKELPVPAPALLAVALLLGCAATAAYLRFDPVRTAVSFLAAAILVVPALFLANPTVRSTLIPDRSDPPALAAPPEVPVVFVIFDALSLTALLDEAGALDADRFPGFAALAARSTWYPRAVAGSDSTVLAVPSILTGRYPRPRTQATFTDHPNSLFTLLGTRPGLHVEESNTQLCPPSICGVPTEVFGSRVPMLLSDVSIVAAHVLLPEEWTGWLPEITERWKDFAGGAGGPLRPLRGSLFRAFIEGIRGDAPPELHYLHTNLPHSPYYFLPSGQAYRRSTREASAQGGQWGEWDPADSWGPAQSQQKYLLQVAFADRLLLELLERLDDEGIGDGVLLVVTADHGTSFRPGDARRRLTPGNAEDIVRVPLFVGRPGQRRGEIDERLVESVDVLPTIADVIGRDVTWDLDGHSVLVDENQRESARVRAVNGGVVEFRAGALGSTASERRFGSGNLQAIFQAGPIPAVVGERLGDLRVSESNQISIALHHGDAWEDVDPEGAHLPSEVTGMVGSVAEVPQPIAVAVNGVVAATTWSYPESGVWSAIVPPDTWQPGKNAVEALLIEDGPDRPDGPVLLRSTDNREASYLGASLGASFVLGVDESGFYPDIKHEGGRMRWTNGDARLRVPLRPDERPSALRVELAPSRSHSPRLEVLVNGCSVFAGQLGPESWAKTLPLKDCAIDDEVVIELKSNVYRDPRALPGAMRSLGIGVRVKSVRLVARTGE